MMRHARRMLLALGLATLISPAAAQMCNLRIVTDASPDYTNMDSMILSITSRWETPEEKCWALFYWTHVARRQTSPMVLHGLALTDPIMQYNDYGYAMCSTVAGINCGVWDAMGMQVRYWDISNHTVPEVYYDGRWHMFDSSMSALYTLCDGVTIAGVEDIGQEGACAASGGVWEPGHIAKYHCLNATSANGFLTGADCARDLDQEYRCFSPNGLKHRAYFNDWDRGHRYRLNLWPGEQYTRYTSRLGDSAHYYIPNDGRDPDDRFGLRGNGLRRFTPDLTPAGVETSCLSLTHAHGVAPRGIEPTDAGTPGVVVFKVEGANVISSLRLRAGIECATADDRAEIAVSTTNGLTWRDVWRSPAAGRHDVALELQEEVSGAYEVLVRVTLMGSNSAAGARLESAAFECITMLNAKTQPRLNLGRNTVHVGAGDPLESVVLWPDLRQGRCDDLVVDQHNVVFQPEHPGYMGVLHADRAGEEAYVTFRIDTPRDVRRITYGGRLYNRAPGARIGFHHSFDDGLSWAQSYELTSTDQPWDVIHYETIGDIPGGVRSVLFRYTLMASEAGPNACSIYGVRMEAEHERIESSDGPLEIVFTWAEAQEDYSLVERSHTALVTELPTTYTLSVGGFDHPVMRSLSVRRAPAGENVEPGYSDGVDVGGERFVDRWVTYGTNLAEGKPYEVTVPSNDSWGAGDPDGTKLTDGVVGPLYAGGVGPSYALGWDAGTTAEITVDLGETTTCGAFRIHVSGGWPWWDALKGEVLDEVEVLTSVDGNAYVSQGWFETNLRRKDIPANHRLPDDETATGWNYELIPDAPSEARYVRFAITPARSLTVSEIQVLDRITYEPFDLRIALPAGDT